MKRNDIIIAVFSLVSLWITVRFGLHTLFLFYIILAGVCAIAYIASANYRRNLLLDKYARQSENIYVWSANEYDRNVRKRANLQRALLEESGCTEAWKSRGLRPPVVVEIFFADGENVNETWEEFQERKEKVIQEDRKRRHIFLNSLPDTDKDKSREWYITEILRQVTE